jgi:NADH dehydrogenase
VFCSVIGASRHHRARLFRAKALAEQAVAEVGLETIVFAPSIVYAPGDRWLTTINRLALLPALPVSGRGTALFEPIWAEDVADCLVASLKRQAPPDGHARYELAGPHVLSENEIVHLALSAAGRRRRIVHVPTPVASRGLRALESALGPRTPATWDEAELMQIPLLAARGVADAQALGVRPRAMRDVLAAAG